MAEEIWKDIRNYKGRYQVSNHGRVKSLDRVYTYIKHYSDKDVIATHHFKGRILSTGHSSGYLSVVLSKDSSNRTFLVHRLVAETFILNKENKPTVNHIDGNKHNTCVDNLEWATYREQIRHVVDNNLRSSQSVQVICIETGEQFPSKRSAETTLGIMKNGVSRSIRSGKPVNGYTFKEIRRIKKKIPKTLFNI